LRSFPARIVLPLAIGAAAVAGIVVGSLTATQPRTTEPSVAVADVPTSTPDLRPTPRPQTLTPTKAPTASAVVQVTTPPNIAPSPVSTPRPAPTGEPRGRPVVFFAAPEKEPAAVPMPTTLGGSSPSDHVFFRLLSLRQQKQGGPDGYLNLVASMRAQLLEVTVETPGTVVVGFSVPSSGDWGVSGDQLKLLLQQIVFTATEEPAIERVLLTQNGGKPALIAGQLVDKALGRAEVR
jgi:hypothetical protein